MAGYATGSPLAISVHIKPRESSLSIFKGTLWMFGITYYYVSSCWNKLRVLWRNFIHDQLRHSITMFFLIYEVNITILHGCATFYVRIIVLNRVVI